MVVKDARSVVRSIKETLLVCPCPIPDMTQQREKLFNAFPADLLR